MNPYFVQNMYLQHQMAHLQQVNRLRYALLQSQLNAASANQEPLIDVESVGTEQSESVFSESAYFSDNRSTSGSDSCSTSGHDSSTSGSSTPQPIGSSDSPKSENSSSAMKNCRYCPATFKSNTDLKRHERIHTGEKPFSCKICHKQFNRKGNMEKHTLTHYKGKDKLDQIRAALATEKSYICDHVGCGKAFRSRGFYNRHQRQHQLELEIQKPLRDQLATPQLPKIAMPTATALIAPITAMLTTQPKNENLDGLPSFVIKALLKKN